MAVIRKMVGGRKWNLNEDVKVVQTLLREWGHYHGPLHGYCDQPTVEAIKAFQESFMAAPSGRISPGSATFYALRGGYKPGVAIASAFTHSQSILSLIEDLCIEKGDEVARSDI